MNIDLVQSCIEKILQPCSWKFCELTSRNNSVVNPSDPKNCCWSVTQCRVLARISKMPVQNSNYKISARPDLATDLLQSLIPTTFNSLLCQKWQFTYLLCHRKWFLRIIFVFTPKMSKLNILNRNFCLSKRCFSGNCLSKRQVGPVLAKSLTQCKRSM